MGVPATLQGQIADLYGEVAELNRRLAHKERTGKVVETKHDEGLYRVELLPAEATADGKPYLSPWLPFREAAAGKNKTHMPLSVGEQVALSSQSGDIRDAEIVQSLPSDENLRPSKKGDEYILSQVGPFELRVSDGGVLAIIKVGGTILKLTPEKLEIQAADIEFFKG